MTGKLRWIVIVLMAWVVGCAGAGMNAYTPLKQKTKFRDDQLFGAAERSLEELGYQPINKDADSGAVATRNKDVDYQSHPRLYFRYAFQIDVGEGIVNINSTCKKNSAMAREELDDCGDERPKHVIDEQEKIYRRILEIASKLP